MKKDTEELIRKCETCQWYLNVSYALTSKLNTLNFMWPVIQWEIDILGLFLLATKQKKFLIILVDYFKKWVKAKPFAITTLVYPGS